MTTQTHPHTNERIYRAASLLFAENCLRPHRDRMGMKVGGVTVTQGVDGAAFITFTQDSESVAIRTEFLGDLIDVLLAAQAVQAQVELEKLDD